MSPEKLNIKMFRFEFEEILDAPHLKTVSWNTNRVNLKYGICITKTSFYSYHLNVRKEKFARELHRLPTVKLNPWKVSPACLHQHKRVLIRATTPNICFVIYFAEISNYFQMYNSNSNAESKIRKKKIINNKSLKKKTYIIRCIVKVLVRHFWKLVII